MAGVLTRTARGHSVYKASVYLSRLSETSTTHVKKRKKPVTIPTFPPENTENDMIGPPDKVSNIRPMKFYVPSDETSIEREYREKREALQQWHHQFWTKHNKSFFQRKEEFVKQRLEAKTVREKIEEEAISPEELSVFYKHFLDDNYKAHQQYNKEWYKRNIALLWPALKVQVLRMWRSNTRKKKSQPPT